MGKEVIYNDFLKFNYTIGKSIIENNNTKLSNESIDFILTKTPNFIEANFEDIYYTNEENIWLDFVIFNINLLQDEYQKSLAC